MGLILVGAGGLVKGGKLDKEVARLLIISSVEEDSV